MTEKRERPWVSSEPFDSADYAQIQEQIEANRGKRFAILECFQEIPCNPCETACPQGAITVGMPLTNLPVLQLEKCSGCGRCIAKCPGLAIFVVDTTAADCDKVWIPYEYLPLPEKGQAVTALDRRGQPVCSAEVMDVATPAEARKTAVIKLQVPRGMGGIVRGMT